MARYTGPTSKLSRRLNKDLGHKTNGAKLTRRLNIPPGAHGRKGSGKLSDYALQLKEKQKVKWIYGLLEKQLRRYFEIAAKTPAATGQELLSLLERRLDNVVYRLNLAPTRNAARQLVGHGHILVDNKKVSIPSYIVKPNQTIQISGVAQKIPAVANLLAQKNTTLPAWLERQALVGHIKNVPSREDSDPDIQEQLIVEYYSR